MRVFTYALGAACLVALAGPAAAQKDAAGLALPDLDVPAEQLGDERKYFILHKPGVTVAQAEKDLNFCWRYLPHGAQRSAPDFIAWRNAQGAAKSSQTSGNYGLVGGVIGGIIAGPLDRSLRQSRIFRCMVPRGYTRYRTSEALWKQLNEGDPERAIRMQVRIAAGPALKTPKVTR